MKYLSEYCEQKPESARIERKFIMTKGQCILAENVLKSIGFRKLHPARNIKSIYFDDVQFNSLRANIDGSPSRDKIRIRTYDHDFNSSVIETKHKRGIVGYKTILDFSNQANNPNTLITKGQEWCRSNLINLFFPAAEISYDRSYYLKDDFRATIDYNVRGFRLANKQRLPSAMINYSVIEFKYPVEMDMDFRSIYHTFSKFALRNTKSSKYSNALMY